MRRPVTVISGFLGSGKTTLIRRLLDSTNASHTAVIVNELGEVGLDHDLLVQVSEQTMLVGSGCLCCSKRDDLVQVLHELITLDDSGKQGHLERVVIETTGIADPAPIIHTVNTDPVLAHQYAVEQVVTTLDCVNADQQLTNHPEALNQLTASDAVVLTKTDLASAESIQSVRRSAEEINPTAAVLDVYADAPLTHQAITSPRPKPINPQSFRSHTVHSQGVGATSISVSDPLDWTVFALWLSMLLHERGEQVLRVKALLDTGDQGPVALNSVRHVVYPPQHLESWQTTGRDSRVAIVAQGIDCDELLRSLYVFQAALA
jgi:G3E family GTPase